MPHIPPSMGRNAVYPLDKRIKIVYTGYRMNRKMRRALKTRGLKLPEGRNKNLIKQEHAQVLFKIGHLNCVILDSKNEIDSLMAKRRDLEAEYINLEQEEQKNASKTEASPELKGPEGSGGSVSQNQSVSGQ